MAAKYDGKNYIKVRPVADLGPRGPGPHLCDKKQQRPHPFLIPVDIFVLTLFKPGGSLGTPPPKVSVHNSQSF